VREVPAALHLIIAGGLVCAYGALLLASIGTSDAATGTLVAYGLAFTVRGVVTSPPGPAYSAAAGREADGDRAA
jgi:hypothetical protein